MRPVTYFNLHHLVSASGERRADLLAGGVAASHSRTVPSQLPEDDAPPVDHQCGAIPVTALTIMLWTDEASVQG